MIARKNKEGRLPGVIIITEEIGNPQAFYGLVGRFRSDPVRALGLLRVMNDKVARFAADEAPELEPPPWSSSR